jgi:hypothetical protein
MASQQGVFLSFPIITPVFKQYHELYIFGDNSYKAHPYQQVGGLMNYHKEKRQIMNNRTVKKFPLWHMIILKHSLELVDPDSMSPCSYIPPTKYVEKQLCLINSIQVTCI